MLNLPDCGDNIVRQHPHQIDVESQSENQFGDEYQSRRVYNYNLKGKKGHKTPRYHVPLLYEKLIMPFKMHRDKEACE